MSLLDLPGTRDRPLHEFIVDRFLHQRAAGASADLALIEGKHGEAFQRFVEEFVVGIHDVRKENIRRLAAQFQRHRNDVVRGVLHDHAPRRRLSGEGNLGDALVLRQRFARFDAKTH